MQVTAETGCGKSVQEMTTVWWKPKVERSTKRERGRAGKRELTAPSQRAQSVEQVPADWNRSSSDRWTWLLWVLLIKRVKTWGENSPNPLMEAPRNFSSQGRWRKSPGCRRGHHFACLRTSINMFNYSNRFRLITSFLTPLCDDASGADHFRARVETTADVIPRIRRPSFGWAQYYMVHHSDMHGSAHQLGSHLQGKHTFNAVWLIFHPKTLARVSCAEDRQSEATK